MFKTEIALNHARIIEAGLYTPDEIMDRIDQMYARLGIEKQAEGVYVGGDFAKHGAAIMRLKRQEWFTPYVDKWLWYNSKGTDHYFVEDVAAHYGLK